MESSQYGKSSPLLWLIFNRLDRLETKINTIFLESSQNGKSSPLLLLIFNQLDRLETKRNKKQDKAEARQKQITEINTMIDKIQKENKERKKQHSDVNAKISVLQNDVRKLKGRYSYIWLQDYLKLIIPCHVLYSFQHGEVLIFICRYFSPSDNEVQRQCQRSTSILKFNVCVKVQRHPLTQIFIMQSLHRSLYLVLYHCYIIINHKKYIHFVIIKAKFYFCHIVHAKTKFNVNVKSQHQCQSSTSVSKLNVHF